MVPINRADDRTMEPVPFTMIAGTMLYLALGWGIDQIVPGAELLGMNMCGFLFSTACLVAALWIGVRYELFD